MHLSAFFKRLSAYLLIGQRLLRNGGFDSSSDCVVCFGFTGLLNRLFDDFGFGNRDCTSDYFVAGLVTFDKT